MCGLSSVCLMRAWGFEALVVGLVAQLCLHDVKEQKIYQQLAGYSRGLEKTLAMAMTGTSSMNSTNKDGSSTDSWSVGDNSGCNDTGTAHATVQIANKDCK